MQDKINSVEDLKKIVEKFVNERNWKQFHTPKNLSMSIAIEAAELMEHFQWIDIEHSKRKIQENKEEIENEIADIAAYLLSLCLYYDIDLSAAIEKKMKINAKKYPI